MQPYQRNIWKIIIVRPYPERRHDDDVLNLQYVRTLRWNYYVRRRATGDKIVIHVCVIVYVQLRTENSVYPYSWG